MRRAALAALLALAACADPLPPGFERRGSGGSDDQGFVWDAATRRLAWIEGAFPNRTYLVVEDLRGGPRRRWRLKGYTLTGRLALTRDGRRAVLEAGKMGPHLSREAPRDKRVLLVDLETGAVLRERDIGRDATAVALGHPSWSSDPVAAWDGPEGLLWSALGEGREGGVLLGPAARLALLAGREPWLAAAVDDERRPALRVTDLLTRQTVRSWPTALTPRALAWDGDRLLASRWDPSTGKFVLESCDPHDGRREVLLETDGEFETALKLPGALYAVAKDPSRPDADGREFLAPRVLLAVEDGRRPWSAPWTSRRGAFLGWDGETRRLWFATADKDRPAAWAIPPEPEALKAAAAVLDR